MRTEEKIRPAANGTDLEAYRTNPQSSATRPCTKCRKDKPMEEFAVDRSKPCGRRSMCAECRADYDSEANFRKRSRMQGHAPVVKPFTREEMTERHGDRCVYCSTGAFETSDHILCVAAGGHHSLENVVPCCAACNNMKRWVIDMPLIRIFRTARAASMAEAA